MNELAIDQRGIERQLAKLIRKRSEFGGPIETAARNQPNLAALDAGEQSVSVVFDFMQPFGSVRGLACKRRKLRLQLVGDPAFASAGNVLHRDGLHRRLFIVAPVRMPYPVAICGDGVQ